MCPGRGSLQESRDRGRKKEAEAGLLTVPKISTLTPASLQEPNMDEGEGFFFLVLKIMTLGN